MSEIIIKKNSTDYPLLTMPNHYPADRVYLDGDTTKSVQDAVDKQEAMIATIQPNLTAVKAYAKGEQFVYQGLLYKATAAISSGGTITIGGNCELSPSVTEQIKYSQLTFTKNSDMGDVQLRGYRFGNVAMITGYFQPRASATSGMKICDISGITASLNTNAISMTNAGTKFMTVAITAGTSALKIDDLPTQPTNNDIYILNMIVCGE